MGNPLPSKPCLITLKSLNGLGDLPRFSPYLYPKDTLCLSLTFARQFPPQSHQNSRLSVLHFLPIHASRVQNLCDLSPPFFLPIWCLSAIIAKMHVNFSSEVAFIARTQEY